MSRPLPPGHEPIELHLTRFPDGEAELRVVSRGPAPRLALDPADVAKRIHEAVRVLAEDAPNIAYVEAAQAAGLVVRGGDVGLLAPIATSDGLVSSPVRRERAEVEAVKAHQKVDAKRKRGSKRTRSEEHTRKMAAKAQRKAVNRRRTRAYQDAAMLVRGNGPGKGSPFLRQHDGQSGC